MKRRLVSLIIFVALTLAAACVPNAASIPQEDSNGVSEEQIENSLQLLGEGIGPLEITPDSSANNRDDSSSGDLVAGNISSSGKQSASTSTSEQPGFSESAAVGDNKDKPSIKWLKYLDPRYKFSIKYPKNYVILPENELLDLSDSNLKYRVRFQDADLAGGDTAEYEIPKFTIEIFDLGTQSLVSFLDSHITGGEREEIQIGDLVGIKVSFKNLLAPNMHYYFQAKGNIYKLTHQGEYGDEMLKSFRIMP